MVPVRSFVHSTFAGMLCRSLLVLAGWLVGCSVSQAAPQGDSTIRAVVNQYCVNCHDADSKKGGLDLDTLSSEALPRHAEAWERVIRKMRTRQMPPVGKKRPDEGTYESVTTRLEAVLDKAAAEHPNPGRTESFRRLNRTEYQNAIKDLLDLSIDAAALLPKDDLNQGFDNVAVANLSPTLLNRYITAAEKISRLAVGALLRAPGGDTFRIAPDVTQEEHVEGLPLGTRGGALFNYTFPRDGQYEIQMRLTRDRNEEVEGLREPHEVIVLLDRQEMKRFTVMPRKGDKDYEKIDAHLKVRLPVSAGPHQLGVTFVKKPTSLIETKRQPYQAHYNVHRHPRQTPALYQVSINGPYESEEPGDSPSRRRLFVRWPADTTDENACAKKILATVMHRAYRRPVTSSDMAKPLEFYERARAAGSFEAGIQAALSAVLVSPEFLFRIEEEPEGVEPGQTYAVSDLDLASRLSFFLWSSIPDDELLATAERHELHKAETLDKEVRRMLADPRAENLVSNFAEQWLQLRNLESITPDLRLFTDFDDNLRQALRRETELHLETILHENRSVLELLKANYTFLNERLAKHYGVPNIYGSRFRRVELDAASERGGLLRQGSILTLTSYATRTSPVIRGKWVLENLFGTPPPPPLPNVPTLKENTIAATLSVRARLAEHRANSACASCHNLMDPIGFSLENFDAIGRWRQTEDGEAIDATGGLPDGSRFAGVAGLEEALLRHPETFVNTLTEKLMTFALGRGVEYYDAPAVRKIVRDAQKENYSLSSLVLGLVHSTPFTQRKAL